MSAYVHGSGPMSLRLKSLANPRDAFPTGRCFDDALDYVARVVGTSDDEKVWLARVAAFQGDLFLVHGLAHWAGTPYAHAWAEHDGSVMEGKFVGGHKVYMKQDKARFYKELKIGRHVRYSVKEADALNAQHNHFGPWEPWLIKRAARSMADF